MTEKGGLILAEKGKLVLATELRLTSLYSHTHIYI